MDQGRAQQSTPAHGSLIPLLLLRFPLKSESRVNPPSILPRPINPHQQDRGQGNKPNRPAAQRNTRNVVLIASLSQHQVSHLVQNHSTTDSESRRSQERHRPVAGPKSPNERRRKCDQDSNEEMMNQMPARIDMLHPDQVKIKPKTQNRPSIGSKMSSRVCLAVGLDDESGTSHRNSKLSAAGL